MSDLLSWVQRAEVFSEVPVVNGVPGGVGPLESILHVYSKLRSIYMETEILIKVSQEAYAAGCHHYSEDGEMWDLLDWLGTIHFGMGGSKGIDCHVVAGVTG
jgi:hypothetical protein